MPAVPSVSVWQPTDRGVLGSCGHRKIEALDPVELTPCPRTINRLLAELPSALVGSL